MVTEPQSHFFYIWHQIGATLFWAFCFMLLGLLIGWLFWGRCKQRVAEIKARNRQLRSELRDLQS